MSQVCGLMESSSCEHPMEGPGVGVYPECAVALVIKVHHNWDLNRNPITPMTAVRPTNPVCQYIARGVDNIMIKSMRLKTVVVVMIIHQRIVLSATMLFISRNGSPTGELGIIATIKHAHLSFSEIQSVSLSLH
jgi:hypothetical protein